ncbi:MAG: peptidyl-prolyl cis-trans isomerase [Treponema sp.]|nr:peptidyl-prolyl cis-trans isomerase [Treponema sp.]
MKKIVLSFLVLLVSAGALFAQSDLQVLAVVKQSKSESVTVKQLKARCETYEKQIGKKLTVDERKQVLEALIEEKLVLQAAAKAGISIPDSSVNQYFLQSMSAQVGANVTEKELNDLIMKSQGKTLEQLLLEQTGMTVAEYKAYLKNQLIAQQYVVSQKQSELSKVAASDDQIRQFYESNKASFVWTDMMKMFLVIVPKNGNPEAAKTKCNELRNKIVDKKLTLDQIEVQAKYENSGYQAGTLLIQKTEPYAMNLGMEYSNLLVLFTRDKGFISDLQETDVDYRIVTVMQKYDAKLLSISDIVQPESTVTVYDYIRSTLTQQLQMQALQQAAQDISNALNTSENVERKKTGDALTKLLDWGN